MQELFDLIFNLDAAITKLSPVFPHIEEWHGLTSTLIVTDECNLRCTYCYCTKNPQKMTWETAKEYIDLVFKDGESLVDVPRNEQNDTDHRKIFEFIGGEPFLESELVFKCMDYIVQNIENLPKEHPWRRRDWPCSCCGKENGLGFRFMLSTNGILLTDPHIQKQLLNYKECAHIGVTLDGTKEMHDLCRKTVDGKGSYDDVMKTWRWLNRYFPNSTLTTKSTIAHDNIDYIAEIIEYFYNLGLIEVSQNCVYENVWHRGDQIRLYRQLIKVADFLLEKERWRKMGVRWFSTNIFKKSEKDTGKWCGAGTYMSAVDSTGQIYPCLRFKQMKDRTPYVMGHVKGELRTKDALADFDRANVNPLYSPAMSSILKCSDCPVSGQCSDCQAYAYDCFGRLDVKSPFLCPMHKATCVANIYFFSKFLGITPDIKYLEDLLESWTQDDYFSSDGDYDYGTS